jgi:hypothetical protein
MFPSQLPQFPVQGHASEFLFSNSFFPCSCLPIFSFLGRLEIVTVTLGSSGMTVTLDHVTFDIIFRLFGPTPLTARRCNDGFRLAVCSYLYINTYISMSISPIKLAVGEARGHMGLLKRPRCHVL